MIDELTIATSVLAAFTGVLAVATAFYAYYTREQVKLLKTGHKLAKQDIAVKALSAFGGVSPVLVTKATMEQKVEDLGLDEDS